MVDTIAEGDCIDSDYFETAFAEIAALAACAETETTQFKCQQVNVSASNFNANGEFCLNIYVPPPAAPGNDEPEEKILLFNFETSVNVQGQDAGDTGGNITSTYRVEIRCDGVTVDSKNRTEANGQIVMSAFQCPPSSIVEICVVSTFVATGFNSQIRALRSFAVCGALICLSQATGTDADASGLYLPGPLPPGCCYGREAAHLAIQNLDALQTIFGEYGQVPSAQSLDYDDLDDHVVLSSVAGDTPYLVVGSVYICATNDTTAQGSVTARPRVECGPNSTNCFTQTRSIPPRQPNSPPSTVCMSVPVIACGVCPAGSDIIVAVRSDISCDEDVIPVNPGSAIDITVERQSYCVFTFEPQQNEFSQRPRPSLGNCPDVATFAAIQQSIAELSAVCGSIAPNNITNFQDDDIVPIGTTVTLVPPFTPPPPAIPGTKTWFITALGQAFGPVLSQTQIPIQTTVVEATMQILCGGVVIQESSARWRIIDAGNSSVNGYFRLRTLPSISGCVRCPVDQPLEILFTANLISGSGAVTPVTAAYDVSGFCF